MRTKTMALAALLAPLALTACGGDSPTAPSGPPPPGVAGSYSGYWLTQFERTHDGYSGSFTCGGTITLVQAPSSKTITGFAVVASSPCPPVSFDLSGTVEAGGAITLKTAGPKPPAGPCPVPPASTYTGTIGQGSSGGGLQLSARSTVMVDCPGPGEGQYRFDQIATFYKY